MKTLISFITEKLRLSTVPQQSLSVTDLTDNIEKINFKIFYNILNTSPKYKLKFFITYVSYAGDNKFETSEIEEYSLASTDSRDTLLKKRVTLSALKDSDFLIYLSPGNNNYIPGVDYVDKIGESIIDDISENDYKNVVVCYQKIDLNGELTQWKMLYNIYNLDVNNTTQTISIYICESRYVKTMLVKQNLSTSKDIEEMPGIFDRNNEDKLLKKLDTSATKFHSQIPDKYKYHKSGESTLFWQVYNTLLMYGPMSKVDVLETINKILGSDLKSTSYATTFAKWKACNQIVGVKGKLNAQPYPDWNV